MRLQIRTRGLALALALALCAPRIGLAQTKSYAYVSELGTNHIVVIDTTTNGIVGTANVPAPAQSAATPDGRAVYATGTATVRSIDAVTLATGTPIAVTNPKRLAIAPNSQTAYVIQSGGPTIQIIDLVSNAIVGSIAADAGAAAIAVSPDGHTAYVAINTSPNAQIDVVDLTTGLVTNRIALTPNAGPADIAVAPDGQHVYAPCVNVGLVAALDVVQGTVSYVNVTGFPFALAVAPAGGRIYVADLVSSLVRIIDTATMTSLNPIVVGAPIEDIAITPDGKTAYLVSPTASTMQTIDLASGTPAPPISLNVPNSVTIGPAVLVPAATPLTVASTTDLANAGVTRDLNFNGGTLRLGANLSLTNDVSLLANGGTIDTNGSTLTLSGSVLNTGKLTKLGAGTLVLTGTATINGTDVNGGTLQVDGFHLPPIRVNAGGTLAGTGNLDTVNALAGGTINPGDNVGQQGGPGILHANTWMLHAGATLTVDVQGLAAGTGYDQLDARALPIVLNSATLSVVPTFTPPSGSQFTIVTHASGRFNGLPDGATLIANGVRFRIHYDGGANADAVVLVADAPPTISPIPNQTLVANGPVAPILFSVSDDITNVSQLVVTATSSNQNLVADPFVSVGGTGTIRWLSLLPKVDTAGQTTITVSVSDGGATTTTSFVVTMTPAVQPRVYYLAEGATGGFFSTDILLANPNAQPAPVTIDFLRDDGVTITQSQTLPAMSRTTIHVGDITRLEATTFSTVVDSSAGLPIVVERTMWWGPSGYGSHTEKASDKPETTWYFAEGSQGYFFTYFLLANAWPTTNVAHVTYFREGAPPLVREYAVPARSRMTIDAGADPELVNQSFGAQVVFDQPAMAERSMYFGTDPLWTGGTGSAGVNALATNWFLAEGATGSYFTTYILLANPGDTDATATMTFLPASGAPVTKTHVVPAHQRLTMNIADEDPSLASAAVATQVASTVPIVVERAQYWPNPTWYEAHASAGVTDLGSRWGLAEGRVGGTSHAQTYILLANPGTTAAADVTITFLRTDGTTIAKHFTVAASSRFNVAVTGAGSDVPELSNESFGALIESSQPIAVERSMYSDANGITWAAGTNATATRLP